MDYLNLRLTGKYAATMNTVFPYVLTDNRNLDSRDYDPALLRLTGVDKAKLPEVSAHGLCRTWENLLRKVGVDQLVRRACRLLADRAAPGHLHHGGSGGAGCSSGGSGQVARDKGSGATGTNTRTNTRGSGRKRPVNCEQLTGRKEDQILVRVEVEKHLEPLVF